MTRKDGSTDCDCCEGCNRTLDETCGQTGVQVYIRDVGYCTMWLCDSCLTEREKTKCKKCGGARVSTRARCYHCKP